MRLVDIVPAITMASMASGFLHPAVKLAGRGARKYSSSCSLLMARKPFIAGNWKMNPGSLDDSVKLAKAVVDAAKKSSGVDVACFPPFPFLPAVKEELKGSPVWVGAQDVYTEDKGAYTGAVAVSMLKSIGSDWILVGHSERRAVFKDTDEVVNKKLHKVLAAGLRPILCIGETKEQYEAGQNKAVCAAQLDIGLKGVSEDQLKDIVIAYEPIWAIGTGLTATPEIAQDVHANVRSILRKKFGEQAADAMVIQYGGSVTPETVDDLMAQNDIDGALVGGASLSGDKFSRIINYVKK